MLCLITVDVWSLLAVGARADCLLLVLTHTVITCLFLVLLARAVFAVSSYYFIYCTLVVYS